MKLKLVFRDTTGKLPNYEIEYKVQRTGLAKSWLRMFIKNFMESDYPIEKTYCLKGWQNTWESSYDRNLEFLCKELNRHIEIINNDLPKKGYDYINLDFNVAALKNEKSQEILLNKIHHHFELLIGQVWNPSKWYGLAEESTRFSIRMLNNYCHEIEAAIAAINNNRLPHLSVGLNGIDQYGKHFVNKQKHEIIESEYREFSSVALPGAITLYYAQLGKHHREAFLDNDTDIHDENISGIRYITGEFLIHFDKQEDFRKNKPYVKWLKRNGFNRNDPSLALDYGVVATPTKEVDVNELKKRNDLYKMQLFDQGTLKYERVFDFTWKDQYEWEKNLTSLA